jgi:hypothetical protein
MGAAAILNGMGDASKGVRFEAGIMEATDMIPPTSPVKGKTKTGRVFATGAISEQLVRARR